MSGNERVGIDRAVTAKLGYLIPHKDSQQTRSLPADSWSCLARLAECFWSRYNAVSTIPSDVQSQSVSTLPKSSATESGASLSYKRPCLINKMK